MERVEYLRRDGHAEMACHRKDLSLDVAPHHVPPPLVDAEGRLSMLYGISIGS